jgi:hypothetical protein
VSVAGQVEVCQRVLPGRRRWRHFDAAGPAQYRAGHRGERPHRIVEELADDLDFAGPLDRFDSADAYQQAMQGLSQMKTETVVHKTFVDGPDVNTCEAETLRPGGPVVTDNARSRRSLNPRDSQPSWPQVVLCTLLTFHVL